MTSFTQQLWVALKIWGIAVAINTLAGTCILTNTAAYSNEVEMLLFFGTFYGAIYSFPVFLLVLLVINRCVANIYTGMWLFWIVLLAGIAGTIGTFAVFGFGMGKGFDELAKLFLSALFSGIAAISTQFRPLAKMNSYKMEEFSF